MILVCNRTLSALVSGFVSLFGAAFPPPTPPLLYRAFVRTVVLACHRALSPLVCGSVLLLGGAVPLASLFGFVILVVASGFVSGIGLRPPTPRFFLRPLFGLVILVCKCALSPLVSLCVFYWPHFFTGPKPTLNTSYTSRKPL